MSITKTVERKPFHAAIRHMIERKLKESLALKTDIGEVED